MGGDPAPAGVDGDDASGRDTDPGDEMVVDASESARSDADSSLDRVRPIFFDGV